ncbi:septum formation initiator family protein [Natranaerobius trueperi]|uniref:septum formation initiator family protein n=1 Tax=Natranaerobius trueperi TaxID=759412 RepID=UPI0013039A44|nr:septum formation initiator family protein [Natranaerobius trueperi]
MYKNQLTAEAAPKRRQNLNKQSDPVRKTKTRRRSKTVPKLAKAKAVGICVGGVLLALLTVAHFALVAQLNYQISQLERELEQIENQKAHLEMKITEKQSYERIERYAREELNMKKPSQVN